MGIGIEMVPPGEFQDTELNCSESGSFREAAWTSYVPSIKRHMEIPLLSVAHGHTLQRLIDRGGSSILTNVG